MNIRYYWYQTISCSSFDSLCAVMIAMFSNDCPYYLSVFCKIHLSVFFCICRIVCNLNRRFGSSQIRWTEWFTCWSVVNWSRCLLWLIYLGCLCVCLLFHNSVRGSCCCCCYRSIAETGKAGEEKNVLLRMRSRFLHMLYFYPVSLLVRHAKLLSCV